jgi:3-hydroxyacyl-CoA dehydrogenase
VTRELAQAASVARRESIAGVEIVERCLYPLINEGARLLEEGIAYRPGDIDVVYTSGYGFPDFGGGPLWMADAIGLRHIVARMDDYARSTGNRYGYWTVCDTLRRYANEGLRLSDWRKPGA